MGRDGAVKNSHLLPAVRKLFRRYGVAPFDINEVAEKDEREILEAVSKARQRAANPVKDTADEENWRPTSDDWIKLALSLAIAHGEPGFRLSSISDPGAWESKKALEKWERDRLYERNLAMGQAAMERMQEAAISGRRLDRAELPKLRNSAKLADPQTAAQAALREMRDRDGYEPADRRSESLTSESLVKHYDDMAELPSVLMERVHLSSLMEEICELADYLTDWDRRSIQRRIAT